MDRTPPRPSSILTDHDGSASAQQSLAKQLANVDTGGGSSIFSQLTNNPFFTAVSPPVFLQLSRAHSGSRGLAWPDSEQPSQSPRKALGMAHRFYGDVSSLTLRSISRMTRILGFCIG